MFKSNIDEHMENSVLEKKHEETMIDEVETVVGPSVVVEGDFSSEGNILVKGTVSGNVQTGRLLTVESGAKILANVKAGDALISGEVKGNVRVAQKLELTETSKILGDINCKILVVSAGALIQGKINMGNVEIESVKTDKKRPMVRTKIKLGGEEE
ncbi:MAG: polymer-forming cytoskeletal protein [Patescibacteria group bacterium]